MPRTRTHVLQYNDCCNNVPIQLWRDLVSYPPRFHLRSFPKMPRSGSKMDTIKVKPLMMVMPFSTGTVAAWLTRRWLKNFSYSREYEKVQNISRRLWYSGCSLMIFNAYLDCLGEVFSLDSSHFWCSGTLKVHKEYTYSTATAKSAGLTPLSASPACKGKIWTQTFTPSEHLCRKHD